MLPSMSSARRQVWIFIAVGLGLTASGFRAGFLDLRFRVYALVLVLGVSNTFQRDFCRML